MMRIALLAGLAACTSEQTTTSSISAQLAAELRDGTMTLSLKLQAPEYDGFGDVPYVLGSDDSLRATFRGHSVPLVASADAYTSSVNPDSDVAGDEEIQVIFERGDDVVRLTATTTADFTLQAPASSADPVTISWSPTAADRMQWQSSSSSVPAADGAIEVDTGQIVFPSGVLAASPPTSATPVMLDVARSRSSEPHTALAKATIEFTRWHSAMVQVTP